jgi:hypothetical protein
VTLGEDPKLLRRLHAVSAAVAELQVHLLTSRAHVAPGGTAAYELDSILEATAALRDAFDYFVRTAIDIHSGTGAAAAT